jgi:hypothetical protein
LLRDDHWLLTHRHERFIYREHLRSHATLTLYDMALPASAMKGLRQSLYPLSALIDLPEKCPIDDQNSYVIRALYNGNLNILMRIDRTRLPVAKPLHGEDLDDDADDEVPF